MLVEGGTFGTYEVRRRIAVGGMGQVFLCRHRVLDRMDAVKVLLPHLASNTDFRRRFLREALSAARVRHPHVVTVYTADEAEGLLYLAMEYVPGEDLGAAIERAGRLDPTRTARLLRPVADALDAAHRAQLVHRDIKPRNLLLSAGPPERLTIVDFGLGRMLDDDAQITKTGEIVGTIAYCPPEQLSRRPVSGATDQYSLACVAFECLTGSVPFPREGQLAIMTAHLTVPPPRASATRPELPAAVDAVLARGMAKDPHDRYATCTHFVAALENALAPVDPTVRGTGEPGPDVVSPAGLLSAARAGLAATRPRGHPDTLEVTVGTDAAGSPVRLRLGAASHAVRGDAEAVAGLVRWLLAQVVVRHDARDICVVGALAPVPDESWLWLNWLPHARPSTLPVSGPHIATTPAAAADLTGRLQTVAEARREDPGPHWPAIFALLDQRLGVPIDEWLQVGRLGVHVVCLIRPHEAVRGDVSIVDVTTPDGRAVARVSGVTGPCDLHLVDQAYARELADILGD
jgi:serine/threonine-protein kinase